MKIILDSGIIIEVNKKELENRIMELLMAKKSVINAAAPKPNGYRKAILGRKTWTFDQEKELADYPRLTTQTKLELARKWGRTPAAIHLRHWQIMKKRTSHWVNKLV